MELKFLYIKDNRSIQLLSKYSIRKHQKTYNFLHIGLEQVGIKNLSKEGLDTLTLLALKDKRFLRYSDSLLAVLETSLSNKPIYFDCFPIFLSHFETKIYTLDVLTLDILS